MTKTCLECDEAFHVKPSSVLKGWGKFCSWFCRNTHGHIQGSRNPNAKMSWDKVVEMRERYRPYKVSVRRLASEYGLSVQQTFDILKGRAWK